MQASNQGPELSSLPSTLAKPWPGVSTASPPHTATGAQRPGTQALGGGLWTMDGHGHALSQ